MKTQKILCISALLVPSIGWATNLFGTEFVLDLWRSNTSTGTAMAHGYVAGVLDNTTEDPNICMRPAAKKTKIELFNEILKQTEQDLPRRRTFTGPNPAYPAAIDITVSLTQLYPCKPSKKD